MINEFLITLFNRLNVKPSRFAKEIGVSHATVRRWLTCDDIPNANSCSKIAGWSGYPLMHVLQAAGYISDNGNGSKLPPIREYLLEKYSDVCSEEFARFIEGTLDTLKARQRAG